MSTTTLETRQQEFLAYLLDEELELPDDWTARHAAGIAIYRNAYRARLVDALRDTYERTARWVGDKAFRQAAAHHVITYPPNSWNLDQVGKGFPATLETLFAGDAEVAELAWLEWAMHRCFVAADSAPLDAAGFAEAAAAFEEEDWANMRLRFLPGTHVHQVCHDISKLWSALAPEHADTPECSPSATRHCIVWREKMKPVFVQVDAIEGEVFNSMLGGARYGETCHALVDALGEDHAVSQAGVMLGRWLHHGMIAGISK